jgi:hypothetical protein
MQTYDLPIHFGNTKGMHEIDSESLIVFINAYKEIFEELTDSKISIKDALIARYRFELPEITGQKETLAT